MRLNRVALFIESANHGVMRTAEKLGVVDCIADCVRLATQTFRGAVRRKSKCPALIARSVALRKRVGSPATRRCRARPLSIYTHRLS
jgi:hypothetical protein